MKNFGYTLSEDRQINYDKNDKKVLAYVKEQEPSFNICISCGTCTATCSTALFTNFNIRYLYTLLKRGEVTNIKKEIAKCMLCGKCMLACPRGVNTRNVIIKINQAIEKYSL